MANNTTTQLTIRINGREVERTLNGMGRELQQLNRQVRNMNEADPNFNDRVRDIRILRREYNGLREDIYGANNATNQFTEGLKGIGAGIVAAFSVDKVLEITRALYDNVERVRQLKSEISAITNLDGSQLRNATTGTVSLAETYQKEEKEILISANAMSKQLSISYSTALDEIKRGFQEGADVSGDMLEQIKEYAPFIKEAGGEAKDLVNIIKAGVVDGVYNDKAIDAVKEGLLRIREMTPATRDAITNLGIDVDDMLAKIKSGQMSYMDAMLLVSKEMDKLGNKSTVTGQALADIFGGPGEDAGFKYISNLYKMNEGVTKLSRTQQEYNRVKDLELEASEKSAILFEALTGEGSKLNTMLTEGKLAAVEFATSLFGIKEARASDDIRDQQVSLKILQNELVNTNTSTNRRKEILLEIQSIYPDIFKNLDLERASNEELSGAIDKVAESLRKRYAIQEAQEKVDDAGAKVGDLEFREKEIRDKIKSLIGEVQTNTEYKLNLSADFNSKDVLEQAKEVQGQLTNGFWESYFRTSDKSKLTGLISDLVLINGYLVGAKTNLEDVLRVQNSVLKQNVLPVEEYRAYYENYSKKQVADWKASQDTSKADPGRADELKRQAKEAADARKRAQKEAEQAAKRIRDERIREAKSLHETLIKEQESFSKKISDAVFNDEQAGIDLMKDGLQKELDQQKLNSEKKILAVTEEINQINKLREDYLKKAETLEASAKKAGKGENKDQYLTDAAKYRDLAEKQIQIVGYKNSTIKALNQKSDAEQLTIYSKYRLKDIEIRQKANDDQFTALQVKHNNELSSATSVEAAKEILAKKYGITELNHIKTIGDARNELQKAQSKEELDTKLSILKQEQEEMQALLDLDTFERENGLINILNDEDRDKLIENLKAAGVAISEVDAAISGNKADEAAKNAEKEDNARSQMLSGINLLGFSADDWDQAFEQLNTAGPEMEKFAAKIQLVEMALQTVSNAWAMMTEAQNKALDRNLKKYEQSNIARKKSLQNQLDQGLISQESYNAQVEALDEALAAKKAEIEYKKAMSEWKMNLVMGQANVALGITKALASTAPPYSYILAGITGAMGLAQAAIMMANKPQKSNFYATGGPTVGLGYTDETGHEVAGTVHANEYVIPEWLLKDPVVADMREFIEARRIGSSSFQNIPNSYATGGNVEPIQSISKENVSSDIALYSVLQDLSYHVQQSNLLYEILITKGVQLTRTMEGAKMLSEDINKYESLMSKMKKS